MQVAEHLISAPEDDQLDDVAVDTIKEEHHGACDAEGPIGEILGFKYQVWVTELDNCIEGIGDHNGSDVSPLPHQSHGAG